MKKILYIPLDERPCNFDFPYLLTEGSDRIRVVRPRKEAMGDKKHPADVSLLSEFLMSECWDADYLILALDTLLYGGIIPSRLHALEKEELKKRLELLKTVKGINPRMRISVFSLVMRCPSYSDSSEEPDYYSVCGREIFLYGQNEHKLRLGEITREEYELERGRLSVCLPYIDDYERRRAINLDLLLESLCTVGDVIDEFTILQDDSNARGYTAMDRERVIATASECGINIDTYPGADEAGMTLLARAVTYLEEKKPRVYVAFPRERVRFTVPIYEDREIYKTVSAQIASAGATECYDESDADLILYCAMNDERTYDAYMDSQSRSDVGYIDGFVTRMHKAVERGCGVVVADLAYCNSGDIALVGELEKRDLTDVLFGYAGWNTASNTVGTAICQGVLRFIYGNTDAHRKFMAHRLLDDAIYCACVRRDMIAKYGASVGKDSSEDLIGKEITESINRSAARVVPSLAERYEAVSCSLPWNRFFEIRLDIEEKNYEA